MSDRNLLLPDSAFSGVMSNIARGVAAVSTRARWPGATQFLDEESTELTVDGLGGDPAWETILTLELDPGRWLIMGATTIERGTVGGSPQWRSGLRASYSIPLIGAVTVEALAADRAVDTDIRLAPLNLHIPILATVEWTVTADVYHRNGNGPNDRGTANALGTSLIAYPL